MRTLVAVLTISLLGPQLGAVDQWPQFRGPQSTGVADDPVLPET